METPLSSRRITRSQTKAILSNISSSKKEETQKSGAKTTKQRTSLIDITNGSPIVGVASAKLLNETPKSSVQKHNKYNDYDKKTPSSGEALLRGQVKNLLQKVEHVSDISKFLSFDTVFGGEYGLKPFLNNSTMPLVAPTPANTPQLLNFNSTFDDFDSFECVFESPVEKICVPQVVSGLESEKVTETSRSLFSEFSSDCSSVINESRKAELQSDFEEEDDASIWSIQVNASIRDEDEYEEVVEEDDAESFCAESETKREVTKLDELCEGIKNISMNDGKTLMAKHIRFVYDSEDELVEEKEILHLKGLPTPEAKHLRFRHEDEE